MGRGLGGMLVTTALGLSGFYGLPSEEVAKLPELPMFAKAMFANPNLGKPGVEYQHDYNDPAKLLDDVLYAAPKIGS